MFCFFAAFAMWKLNAGESQTMTRSGFCFFNTRLIFTMSFRKCPACANALCAIAAFSTVFCRSSQPAAAILGPPTPVNSIVGSASRMAFIRPAQWLSPLGSAALMKIRDGFCSFVIGFFGKK